ncbi:MAG TPA: CPBP family intramembrane glutamic endopeptidase [Microlunatus sp.]
MNEGGSGSAWRAFWNRGGWWRALLLVVVYLALYLGAGWVGEKLFGDQIQASMFSTAGSVFAAVTWSLIVGAILLTGFLLSVGWFRPLFARQPLGGRWWMWIAPALIVITLVMRYVGIDYSVYPGGAIAMTLVTGLFIGFVEEVLTRGIVVKMLRDAGTSEWLVMLGSALAFGLMHSVNLLSGMSLLVVGITVLFAFGFGILMYVTLRVTGNLIWPILLHALYDPTLFLSTGGIDVASAKAQSVLVTLAGSANIVFIIAAFLLIPAVIVSDRLAAGRSAQEVVAPG